MLRIETEFVDTAAVPKDRQHLVWAAQSSVSRLEPENITHGFNAKGAFWRLGPVVVASAQVDAFRSMRGSAAIAAHPIGYVLIVLPIDGEVIVTMNGDEQRCAAPDAAFFDYARPYSQRTTRIRFTLAYFARDFLEEIVGPITAHGLLPANAK